MSPVQNSATVESLTAEVRVLMVGSRQVTLSVFRQLDWVDWDECEPFGRVRDSNGEEKTIVGRHRTTGGLIRAAVPRADGWTYRDGQEYNALKQKYDGLQKTIQDKEATILQYEAIRNDVSRTLQERGRAEQSLAWFRKELAEAQDNLPKIRKQIVELEDWYQKAQVHVARMKCITAIYEALPLIVLAGLR